MKKEYFKVLTKEKDKYYSAFAHGWYRVRYQPNQWTKARKGKLFVFNSRQEANKFLRSGFGDCVLSCKVKGLSQPRGSLGRLYQTYAEFWNKIIGKRSLPIMKNCWPPGTLWANEVRILPQQKKR